MSARVNFSNATNNLRNGNRCGDPSSLGAGTQPPRAVDARALLTSSSLGAETRGVDQEVRSNRWTPYTPEEVEGE